MFDYFYGQSGEMFSYFRVPKILFRDIKFKDLSTDAKTLYGILLDRMGLSVKNGWLGEQGRVYIIFPVQEVMDALGCADNKATKLFRELEKFGLIERKRRGLGKPNLIYVKNFADPRFRNREKNGSSAANSAQQETAKSRGNKTEWNKTEGSEPDPFSSDAEDELDERTRLEAYFMQSSEVDLLLRACPDEEDTIHQIVNLLVDTCATNRKLLRVAGDDKPAEVVRSRFMKLNLQKKTGKNSTKPSRQKSAVPRTAQQSIPMQRMFEDGTCRVKNGYYTRTVEFQDINYQLALPEDRTAIYEEWCSFLNFFDSSIHFELSFVNTATDSTEFEKSIRIPFQKDGFDDVRAEYSQMLRQQLSKGNNGLTKRKYLTFGVSGESMQQVKARLDHIQNDLLNNFHRLGVQAKPLDGRERLKLMHGIFNLDGESKFYFDWKKLAAGGLTVKDAIAPTAFAFQNSRTFQMGGIFGSVSYLSITASDLSDQLLKDFLDMDSSQIVTMHVQSVDQNKAIKNVKRTITELDRSTIEEQKKAIRAGYDMEILPSDLKTYGRDAKALLKELQSQNERMFLVTILVLNTGRTEQELETNVFQASSIVQKHNCNLCRLDFQQEQGLMSSLPLADCQVEIQRGLTTSSTAIFVPFTTQELYQSGRESLYYGLNALSNNLIMVDRKRLKNPNGLILGTPGSGKSFSAKREITNAFLVTDDDIIVCDPEAEYAPLVERLHGQVIRISPASTQYINPLDINSNYSEEDNPLALKADFILSLCELVVGGKEGLLPVEKTVIDRCVHLIYRKYFADPAPENMPLLEDLYNALLQQDEKEAHHVAAALEIYVKGSLNVFNHRTNVDINNRIVCFDIKQLGKQLKKLGMQSAQRGTAAGSAKQNN